MKGNIKRILAFVFAMVLLVTSTTSIMPTNVSAEDTVEDIVLTNMIYNYEQYNTSGTVKYVNRTMSISGATSAHKYMIIRYTGTISRARTTFTDSAGATLGATKWFDPSKNSSVGVLVNHNKVYTSETGAVLILDLEASGIEVENAVKVALSSDGQALNITDCRLSATYPTDDVILEKAIGTYGTADSTAYAYKDPYVTNVTADYKYMVISYVGSAKRCRVSFYDDSRTSLGTRYLDPSQSSTDAVLVNHNTVFTSETGGTIVVDIEASGFNMADVGSFRVSTENNIFEITDCRLTTTAPLDDIVLQNMIATYGTADSTAYAYKEAAVTNVTAGYKYLIFSYVGNAKKCRFGFYNASGKIGTELYVDPSQSSSDIALVGNPVFSSETGATIVVDLEKSGISSEGLTKLRGHSNGQIFEITDCRLTTTIPFDLIEDTDATKLVGVYGADSSSGYAYKSETFSGLTYAHKYLVVSYVGNISRYRLSFYNADGKIDTEKWFDPSQSSSRLSLIKHNGVFESEDEAMIVVDLEASGIEPEELTSITAHSNDRALEVTEFRFVKTMPDIKMNDIVLTNLIDVYGEDTSAAYTYRDGSFSGAYAEQKYLVIKYVGDISRYRFGFYNSEGKIGSEGWVDPSQSSTDLTLVKHNGVFRSDTEAMVVVDLEASGIAVEDLVRIRAHSEKRALEITDVRLTATLPDIPVEDKILIYAIHDFGTVEESADYSANISDATSDYKYIIMTYKGDISQLRLQGVQNSTAIGDYLWMDQTAESKLTLVGDNLVLDSDEITRVVIDVEASGIDLDNWDYLNMQFGPGTLEIGNVRASQSPEIKDVDTFRYFSNKAPLEDYAYSFAVVGDTQIVTNKDKNNGTKNLDKLYDWIIDNKTDKNIQYVFGLGDVVETISTTEFEIAQTAISKLDGQIPYSLIRGNHDIPGCVFETDVTDDYFTQYLGTEAYKNQFANGGFYEEDNIFNAWNTFSVGNIDYLSLALDYCPSDEVLAWASEIVESHPNHNVIVTTHTYLDSDGKPIIINPGTYVVNDGEKMWDEFVSQHENIVLVMGGHVANDEIVVSEQTGVNGNKVTSMLINPQGVDKAEGIAGMVAMLYFSEDGKNVQVEYYSTTREKYFLEANQFSMELPVIERAVVENKVTVDGEEVDVVDGQVTLGDAEIGYYCTTDNKMYKANETITVEEDMVFVTADIAIAATSGAGIRLTDPTGIRFQVKLSSENLSIDDLQNAEVISEGTIITTNDQYVSNGELTLESDYAKVVIPNTGWHNDVEGVYCGSLVNIKESNYIREFIAVGYLTIKYADGEEKTIYSNMTNARSVKWVAQTIIDTDRILNYTEEQQALINTFAAAK